MKKEWTFELDGKAHNIKFFPKIWTGEHRLIVDGKDMIIKGSGFQVIRHEDIPISIGEEDCRFILLGTKADVVVQGICLDRKKKYKVVKGIPWWAWIFVIICLFFPNECMNGVLSYLFGIPSAYLCARVAISPYIHVIFRIILCYLIMNFGAAFCVISAIALGLA